MSRKTTAQAPAADTAIAAAFEDALETAWRKRPSTTAVEIDKAEFSTNSKRGASVNGAPIMRVTITAALPMPAHAAARFDKLKTSESVGDDVKHAAQVAIARAVSRAIADGAHGIVIDAAIGAPVQARTTEHNGTREFTDTPHGRAIVSCGCPAALKAGYAIAGLYDVAKQAEVYAAQDAATAQLADAAAALQALGLSKDQLAELLQAATA